MLKECVSELSIKIQFFWVFPLEGILVQEMAKYVFVKKIVIISSIKSKGELPLPMKMAKRTNVHKLLPNTMD